MTEFMIIRNLTQWKKIAHIFPVELLNQNYETCVWLLIQLFHSRNMSRIFVDQLFYHIRDLRRIRIHLNKSTAISLAIALVSSRLDYGTVSHCCSVVPKNIKQACSVFRIALPE